MNIMAKEYSFEEDGRQVEGVFIYDRDIITENEAHLIINEYGAEMNNRVFNDDAPCLFLPKGKLKLLFTYLINMYKE